MWTAVKDLVYVSPWVVVLLLASKQQKVQGNHGNGSISEMAGWIGCVHSSLTCGVIMSDGGQLHIHLNGRDIVFERNFQIENFQILNLIIISQWIHKPATLIIYLNLSLTC